MQCDKIILILVPSISAKTAFLAFYSNILEIPAKINIPSMRTICEYFY
jgi:hypothetical protein